MCYYPENVCELFPEDYLLSEMEVESYRGLPLYDASGEVLGIIVVMHDGPMGGEDVAPMILQVFATRAGTELERKRAQDALTRYARELARSNADLEQFAYVISHDLQEPLRMVMSYMRLLERRYGDNLDARAHTYIEYAVDGAERMGMLIKDLLAYSRVGTKGADFELTPMETVLEDVLANLSVSIEESGAQVTHTSLPVLLADAVQMSQLLQNLIANAIKFCGDAPPQVHISAELIEDVWRFSVHDHGIGIDPKHTDRIFMIFQRLHTQQEYPGTGMGLAICKRIVERHGGRIWVASQPGEGATFYFTIPQQLEPLS